MQPVNLFKLASQQAQWLSARQAAVAGNIANANTPGYRAIDVAPFESLLGDASVGMRATSPGHFGVQASQVSFKTRDDDMSKAALPSKNTVVVENELIKSGEVSRAFELNTAIVKAFNRMTLMALKG